MNISGSPLFRKSDAMGRCEPEPENFEKLEPVKNNWLILTVITLFFLPPVLQAQKPPLLKLRYAENYTPTYPEIIDMFRLLDAHYAEARLVEAGPTDCGKPLHTFIISKSRQFDPEKLRKAGKTIVLINNGIHPGEPEGIDASLKFADDLLRNLDNRGRWLDQTVLVIIPAYNIGGLLNRSAYNRSGQTTPYETGFRGNYANLDLNRDFTKCDSENARSFTRIFQQWNPDLFLDTHTTNGSDHQYAITLIPPQPDLFPPVMEKMISEKMLPFLYGAMKKGNYELIPYVDWFYEDVRSGIRGGQESPRYSSGYAARFHSYGMMTENLIYKPYVDRVESTYNFLCALMKFASENGEAIRQSRKKGVEETLKMDRFPIAFQVDTVRFQTIEFKGYEPDRQQKSPVTGLPRPGYDRSRPFTASITYYDRYNPSEFVKVPRYYVVPQAWKPVLERLRLNGVGYRELARDTLIEVTVDYIENCTNQPASYNGHFYHEKVSTRSEVQSIQYYAGDWLVPVRQERMRYLIEMLEPRAKDSFFRWNFFDSILDQREYFSPFGFEENALRTLNEFPELKKELEEKRASDPEFAQNHNAQMAFIYNHSPWLEKSWRRYPVGRIF